MKTFGKLTIGAVMLAGTALVATAATTVPADARVSFGIGLGVPGPYYDNPCANPRYRFYHRDYCYRDYYDDGYYGADYGTGFWITDSFGHRHWHAGSRGNYHHR